MAHKQQDISPVKRSQQRNDSAKIMAHSMNLQSKPAAPERVIPEKDKHENEKLKMAHKQQPGPFSPVKRTQWPNDYGKKILSQFMDLHSKTAAPEGAIPENDNHENENLERVEMVDRHRPKQKNIIISSVQKENQTINEKYITYTYKKNWIFKPW